MNSKGFDRVIAVRLAQKRQAAAARVFDFS
jgi:hypothetical protein